MLASPRVTFRRCRAFPVILPERCRRGARMTPSREDFSAARPDPAAPPAHGPDDDQPSPLQVDITDQALETALLGPAAPVTARPAGTGGVRLVARHAAGA